MDDAATMTATPRPPLVSMAEFDEIFESVKNWGRWGPDDQLGTLNYITPEKVREAAGLVRSGRHVSMEIPINTVAGPDNPNPAIHMVTQAHDIDIGSSGLRFGLDFLGMACHGDCHTHVDALCHISYNGQIYNGKPAEEVLTSKGATTLDIAAYGTGLVGRGVLLDIPRFRGVKWLEPGEAVTRAELEACEAAQGVRLGEGDIFVFRTGHHRRRLELGAWNNDCPPAGEGQGGPPRRHHPVDARARDRRVPAGRRRRGGPEHGRGDALPDPSRCRSRRWGCSPPTASSSRTWPRPARRRAAASSWSSGCRSGCPAGPARPGTRSRSSEGGSHRKKRRRICSGSGGPTSHTSSSGGGRAQERMTSDPARSPTSNRSGR